MGKIRAGMTTDVTFDCVPVPIPVANLLARNTNRKDPVPQIQQLGNISILLDYVVDSRLVLYEGSGHDLLHDDATFDPMFVYPSRSFPRLEGIPHRACVPFEMPAWLV